MSIERSLPAVCPTPVILSAVRCLFIERRPLGITWEADHRPKVTALVRRMEQRQSFRDNPVPWWEPGVTYATDEERAWSTDKTINMGPALAEWMRSNR